MFYIFSEKFGRNSGIFPAFFRHFSGFFRFVGGFLWGNLGHNFNKKLRENMEFSREFYGVFTGNYGDLEKTEFLREFVENGDLLENRINYW